MKTDEQLSKLWDKYAAAKIKQEEEKTKSILNQLAGEYYPLVEEVAQRMSHNLKDITSEECASYGVDGLYEAIDKFDRSMGIQFKTFAPHRIRGAILDNIRKADWVPRLVRQRNAVIERVRQNFFKENGHYPSEMEMADILNYSQEQFRILSKKSIPVGVASMFNKPKNSESEEFEEILNISHEKEEEPIRGMLREEMFKKLLGSDFTRFERRIVYLHYYQGLTMKEIAQTTGFSESRISQMHGEVLKRLQDKIERNPEYASELEKILQS